VMSLTGHVLTEQARFPPESAPVQCSRCASMSRPFRLRVNPPRRTKLPARSRRIPPAVVSPGMLRLPFRTTGLPVLIRLGKYFTSCAEQ
jgi:hypothetical protein